MMKSSAAYIVGHHYLGHPLQNGFIICDNDSVFGKNKPEQEKEADSAVPNRSAAGTATSITAIFE